MLTNTTAGRAGGTEDILERLVTGLPKPREI